MALAAIAVFALACAAHADDFNLAGVSADAQAYVAGLTKRHPAGGTPQLRRAADQTAATALQKKDYAAAAAALEERASLGAPTAQTWLDLATALLRKSPADPKRALAAGWENFQAAQPGYGEIPGLLVMAEALRAMDRSEQEAMTLEQVVQRAPDNA
ncbi:MAG TPA: hypothetical protein VHS58_05735, partial [Acetobacteraceae bacterium]|nr:hypothetical protein [Acetobacteraceae bacterium]